MHFSNVLTLPELKLNVVVMSLRYGIRPWHQSVEPSRG